MRRCLKAGMSADPGPSSQAPNADEPLCHTCNRINPRKQTISCSQCDHIYHLNCVSITQVQAAQLSTWHCNDCLITDHLRDAVRDVPRDNQTHPDDMAAALADLKARTRLLQHVPRRHRDRIASDLAGAITAALEQRTPLARWRLFSFAYQSSLAETANPPSDSHKTHESSSETYVDGLSRRVLRKCADGDIRAALRLLTTSGCVAPPSKELNDALRAKHPPFHPGRYPARAPRPKPAPPRCHGRRRAGIH